MLLKLEESVIIFTIRKVPGSVSIQRTLPIEQFKLNHQRDIGRAEGRFSSKCRNVQVSISYFNFPHQQLFWSVSSKADLILIARAAHHRNNLFLPVLEI